MVLSRGINGTSRSKKMKFSNEKLKYINKLAKEFEEFLDNLAEESRENNDFSRVNEFNSYKRKAYLIKEYSEELNNEKV